MWRTRGAAALRARGPFQGQRILRNGLCPQRQRLVRGRQLRKTQRRKNRSQDRNQKGGLNHGVQARSQDRIQVEKRKVSRQRSSAPGAQIPKTSRERLAGVVPSMRLSFSGPSLPLAGPWKDRSRSPVYGSSPYVFRTACDASRSSLACRPAGCTCAGWIASSNLISLPLFFPLLLRRSSQGEGWKARSVAKRSR